jgi:hypothetical protein
MSVVAEGSRSRATTSWILPFSSTLSMFVAEVAKTTVPPSADTAVKTLLPLASVPDAGALTR